MRFIITLTFLIASTVSIFGQISPGLKVGFGYSYVQDKNDSVATPNNYHTVTGYPTISIEKPFPIEINLKKRLSINPGIAYHFFNEEDSIGKFDYGKNFNLHHHSVNAFVKVLYQKKFRGKTEAFAYAGGIGGINLHTKTRGEKHIYKLSLEIPKFDNPINENASDFFGMFYYGAVIGFQPNARRYNYIKPSFEIAYFPAFISKPIEAEQLEFRDINTIQFTVFLGIRTK